MSNDQFMREMHTQTGKTRQLYAQAGHANPEEAMFKQGISLVKSLYDTLVLNPPQFVGVANALIRQCPAIHVMLGHVFQGWVNIVMGSDGVPFLYVVNSQIPLPPFDVLVNQRLPGLPQNFPPSR